MKFILRFTSHALEDLRGLDKKDARRIIDKLDWFVIQKNPLLFAKKLKDFKYGTYRFRVGDYRVLFDIEKESKEISILMVLRVKHRREVYN